MNNIELQIIGQRFYLLVKTISNSINLTIASICNSMNMDRTTLYLYKNGSRNIIYKSIALYTYGININWLISGKGSPFNDEEAGKILAEKIKSLPEFE